MQKGFVLYHSYLKTLAPLNDTEVGRLVRACLVYSMTGEEQELRGQERVLFPTIQEQIDRDSAKYEEKCEKLRKNAIRGVEARRANGNQLVADGSKWSPNGNHLVANANANANANETIYSPKSPQGDCEKKAKRFTPPSVEEVREYCIERNNGIDPELFVDFYASKGWKIGNNVMKDWKAAVRTWERPRKGTPTLSQPIKLSPPKNDPRAADREYFELARKRLGT